MTDLKIPSLNLYQERQINNRYSNTMRDAQPQKMDRLISNREYPSPQFKESIFNRINYDLPIQHTLSARAMSSEHINQNNRYHCKLCKQNMKAALRCNCEDEEKKNKAKAMNNQNFPIRGAYTNNSEYYAKAQKQENFRSKYQQQNPQNVQINQQHTYKQQNIHSPRVISDQKMHRNQYQNNIAQNRGYQPQSSQSNSSRRIVSETAYSAEDYAKRVQIIRIQMPPKHQPKPQSSSHSSRKSQLSLDQRKHQQSNYFKPIKGFDANFQKTIRYKHMEINQIDLDLSDSSLKIDLNSLVQTKKSYIRESERILARLNNILQREKQYNFNRNKNTYTIPHTNTYDKKTQNPRIDEPKPHKIFFHYGN